MTPIHVSLGNLQKAVDASMEMMQTTNLIARIWEKDPAVWKREQSHQQSIKSRLGWLHSTKIMIEQCANVLSFADEIKRDGYQHAVLLGMGGSSLCPDVCRATFGSANGHPELLVLDSTVPAAVLSVERAVDLSRTLFIVSSKSGTTTESNVLFKYFYGKVKAKKGKKAGENFIAITDSGTPLEELGHQLKFRRLFLNPADIGGRYSALSYFGLVPMALIGMDVRKLLDRAERMELACGFSVAAKENPVALLGAILGEAYKQGRDKVTFFVSPAIETFGYWVEQLIAESTGKEGKGIVPVEGETVDGPDVYGNDRLFVEISVTKRSDTEREKRLNALRQAGHPVVRITLDDPYDLGGEFFRWEFATAVAGAILQINPFDEPNVKESKDNTVRLIEEFKSKGELTEEDPVITENGLSFYCDMEYLHKLDSSSKKKNSFVGLLAAHFQQAKPGDYASMMAYIEMTKRHRKLLHQSRMKIRDELHIATAVGFGPRYLHSTGQLHKGGAGNGLFLQITSDDAEDAKIPDEPYSFSILKQAQAIGDFQSLINRKFRAVKVQLGKDTEVCLKNLIVAIDQALSLKS